MVGKRVPTLKKYIVLYQVDISMQYCWQVFKQKGNFALNQRTKSICCKSHCQYKMLDCSQINAKYNRKLHICFMRRFSSRKRYSAPQLGFFSVPAMLTFLS